MTNPDHPEHTDGGPGGGIETLVRATLTAVAERTDVAPRPFASGADDGPPVGERTRLTGRDVDEIVELTAINGATAALRPSEPASGRRRWAVLAAAAALVAVVIGILGVAADQDTITTGPGGAGDPARTAAPGPPLIVSAPRDVLGLELMDVQTATWFGPNTPGSIRSSTGSTLPAPIAAKMAGQTVHPFVETAPAGVTVWYTFFPPGEEPVLTVTPGASEQPRLQVIVKMGVTVDPAVRSTLAGVPSDAIEGLVVAPAQEVCGLSTNGTWPPSADTTSVTTAASTPGSPIQPYDPTACRVVQVAWTDDAVIIVDGDPDLVLDGVIAGLRGEELSALEARLAGISDTGRIRRSLEEAMPWLLPDRADHDPSEPSGTVAPSVPPGSDRATTAPG